MKITREVKTAIMALVAIGLVIYGYNFMKGQNIFDSSKDFFAVYDNVDGLSKSADVTINGLKVGKVSKIEFLNKKGKLLVKFNVNSSFDFSKNSEAVIYSDGLIGGKGIKIMPNYEGATAKSGDTLPSLIETELIESLTRRLEPLEANLHSAISGIDSLVQGLNHVLDQQGQADLKESLASLNQTMAHLNKITQQANTLLSENSSKINGVIDNLDHTAHNFSRISDSLAQVEVKSLVDEIEGTVSNFNQISAQLKNGEGTAGKLLQDEGVYDNLNRASKELEELLEDIKLNPRRYINLKFSIFGGRNKTEAYQKP